MLLCKMGRSVVLTVGDRNELNAPGGSTGKLLTSSVALPTFLTLHPLLHPAGPVVLCAGLSLLGPSPLS